MRTSDPIGRWAPYEEQRRHARAHGVAAVLLLAVGLDALLYAFAVAGVQVAP